MKKIIALNGMATCGKTTIAKMISRYVATKNISSIDPYRNIPYMLGFEEGDKGEEYRFMLSKIKELSIDLNDYPLQYVSEKIEGFYEDDSLEILLVDIREVEEIAKLKLKYPELITLLVRNSNVKQLTSNDSDRYVEDYPYQHIIDNSGTLEELEESVKLFLGVLRRG